MKDLTRARLEVIIESPFITAYRFNEIYPVLLELSRKGVAVTINTRNPIEHNGRYREQAYAAVNSLQSLGIQVLYTVKLHRKLAVIDRTIVWEGSLNILSFNDSSEIMRRVKNKKGAHNLFKFLSIYS